MTSRMMAFVLVASIPSHVITGLVKPGTINIVPTHSSSYSGISSILSVNWPRIVHAIFSYAFVHGSGWK